MKKQNNNDFSLKELKDIFLSAICLAVAVSCLKEYLEKKQNEIASTINEILEEDLSNEEMDN